MAAVVSRFLLALCVLPVSGDLARESPEDLVSSVRQNFARANFDAARQGAQRGYDRWRNRPDTPWHWEFRLLLAESLLELDRLKEVPRLLSTEPQDAVRRGRYHADLAFLHYRRRDFPEAERHLKTSEPLLSGVPVAAARAELTRGMIRLKQERYREAETSFKKVATAAGGSGSLLECYASINLGILYLGEFRYDESLRQFEAARRIASSLGIARAESLAIGNLGVVRVWLGDIDQAVKLLKEAADISARIGDVSYQQAWLAMAGEAYESVREFDTARAYYEKARSLARPGIDDDWLRTILQNMANVAFETGDIETAKRLNKEVSDLANVTGGRNARVQPLLNEARIAEAADDYTRARAHFESAIEVSRETGDPIHEWMCHAGLARIYRAKGEWRQADGSYKAAIRVVEGERSKIGHDDLKLTFLSSLIRFYREYVDYLMERGQARQAFSVAMASRARLLSEKLRTSAPAEADSSPLRLQQLISQHDTVLAFYWIAPRRSFLWLVDGGGLRSFVLPAEDEIRTHVEKWRSAILQGEQPSETEQGSGRWLYTHLVSDHFQVPRGHRLIVVPDGSLFELNFETLPVDGGTRYWIEDVSISIGLSLPLLKRAPRFAALSRPAGNGNDRLLLVGDPDFESDEFPRLAHLKSEISEVGSRFANKDVLRGALATPGAYRQVKTDSYTTIHFAAHAVASLESPLDSAIILAPDENGHKLYARDVMQHAVRASLVTLSACHTAGAKTYAGEGLTGLAWAFLSAGASNVVAGLWEVDDRATSKLMAGFYKALQEGEIPPSALRSAKLELMQSSPVYRKPFYWAAFQIFTTAVY
jgi:CHAT domain-containing protein/Tfp pilus assembly protein PilF